jgi:hypothetical protein
MDWFYKKNEDYHIYISLFHGLWMGCFQFFVLIKPLNTVFQTVETIHGKDEVTGSIPVEDSKVKSS